LAATKLMLSGWALKHPIYQGESPMPEWHGEQTVETATEARQGVTGHNVRYVLVWGVGGVIVAFAIVYFLFFR
jgi:hypothetical protein